MFASGIDVLVVGAGPVGLALALEVGRRGHRVMVVEQHPRGGHQPRAKSTNIRSMAHFRRWGLAQAVRDASPMPADYPTDIVFATRLFGHELARFENVFFGHRGRSDTFPEPGQWIPQYTIEAVLRQALSRLPNVWVRFGMALTALEETEDGVTASLSGPAAPGERVQTRYLVGADGGRSTTRRLIGALLEGDHAYMQNFIAIFHAPGLLQSHPQAKAISYWLVNKDTPAVIGPMDRGDMWFFSTQLRDRPPPSPEEAVTEIRRAIGREDIVVGLLETDVWQAHKLIADHYSRGRVYLAGDSCHLHPPMGGYGMNQGIGDAVDLGWKLSAVLDGWAPPALLDTYETERKPVHQMFVAEATANYGFVTHHMVMDRLEEESSAGADARQNLGERILAAKGREFRPIGVILGYSYESRCIIPDGTRASAISPMEYHPTARPGALAPHLWLADGASIYDRFGPDFTLLVLAHEIPADAHRLHDAAKRRGMPLPLVHVPDGGAAALYDAAMVLIRPDQHVAWRGDRVMGDPDALLAGVAGWDVAASAFALAEHCEL